MNDEDDDYNDSVDDDDDDHHQDDAALYSYSYQPKKELTKKKHDVLLKAPVKM